MKIYIITDLEGTAGVARWEQCNEESGSYPQAVRLLTAELQACVAGIQAAAPQAKVWVWDAHGPGGLDYEGMPRGTRLINRGRISPPSFLDESFDAVFFLAQHAKAGTRDATLAHSYMSTSIESIHINGVELGEFGCRAAMAGTMGVPTVFVSGDDKMMAEARALIPNIYGAQVKVGLAPQLALHLPPAEARDLISQVAAEATAHISEVAPYRLPGPPYEQRIRIWARTDPTDYVSRGFTQVEARTFVKVADRLEDLFV